MREERSNLWMQSESYDVVEKLDACIDMLYILAGNDQ
jgi:hypothetical protein